MLTFFSLFLFVSCNDESKVEKAIAEINIDISVERFDQFFGNAESGDLPKLKQAYPFMFPKTYKDSFWIAKMKDTLQQELTYETDKVYSNFNNVEIEIESLFNHLKYYFPEFNPPRVITTTSSVDYRNKNYYY